VIERTATRTASKAGIYRLSATYLNRETGESYPIATDAKIEIAADAPEIPGPQLDLVTQLRTRAAGIGRGVKGIEPLFELVNRIDQYDPDRDYVLQADAAFSYRLQHDPDADRLSLVYGLAIAKVLQQDVSGALEAADRMIALDPSNPYHHAYLGFIYLYDWNPRRAGRALDRALELNPTIPEVKLLGGVAALTGGDFRKAWERLR
jgi:predicted Zn-dependent protease